ncbi:MAG: hypothetical protein H0W72_01840 [Planctomycetes bacterium]|nr:hypothetical protein [Planctomycetota bacterium]
MKRLIAPIIIITLGIAWLLTAMEVWQTVNWVWVLGLALAGALVLVVGGFNRTTLVLGPFLIICAGFSVARQAGKISESVELPTLVIIFGVLSLLAVVLPVRDASAKA